MKNYFPTVLGIFIILFVFMASAKADGFKEGKWAMTMVMKMDNLSPEMAAEMKQIQNLPPEAQAMMKARGMDMSVNGQGMTMSITQCLTKQNPVPKRSPAQKYCTETHDINGSTVTFHMVCNHDNMKGESTGSMTYTGDTMQGQIKSHEVSSGQTMDATIDITGQYQGPCSS